MRFCILSMPRGGSTFLTTTLDTVAGILSLPAILSLREWDDTTASDSLRALKTKIDPRWNDFERRRRRPFALLKELEAAGGHRVFGFKHHLTASDWTVTERLVEKRRLPKILLRRDNLLASFSSQKIVELTGQGQVMQGEDVLRMQCTFSAAEFRTYLYRRGKALDRWLPRIREAKAPVLEISYSDLRRDIGPVLSFLGVDPTARREVPSVKRNSDDILSRFANPEAVMACLTEIGREDWAIEH